MFVDVVKIKIKAGKGGDGRVNFHREKYIAAGGPDGGDGGRGGSVVFVVDDHMSTLLDFRYKRKYIAQDGEMGGKQKCFGKDAPNLTIKVPRGTLIKDAATGALMADMSGDEPFVAARGGRGGWGNVHFATPTRQAPRFAKPGLPGDERELILELKLIADVGLLGFPNVGKSTLLSVISAARPKIANYHFTTLTPNLGVVRVDEGCNFVCADIPGIIEGAAQGAGLGHDFLRHVDRCRLLVHLVDVSGSEGRDPVEDLDTINRELQDYSPALAQRPQIIVANKCDMLESSPTDVEAFEQFVDENGWELFYVSAVTGEGLDDLIHAVGERLQLLPPITVYESEVVKTEAVAATADDIVIRREDGKFIVEGDFIYNIMGRINFDNYESLNYFQHTLQKNGVFEKLEAAGCQDGDTVSIYDFEFDYVK